MKQLSGGSILRKLLIAVPLILALTAVSLFMPARQVSIEGIGTLSLGQEVAYASPDWYDPSWGYRRAITLTPETSVADYQVLVTLDIATMGNPYAHVESDGSDIRFTGSDEVTLQNYWIESWDNNGTSKIWVEVKASGTPTIYMYYGNAAAGSTSDGDTTFVFFDDFESGNLNKWTGDTHFVIDSVQKHGGAYSMKCTQVTNQQLHVEAAALDIADCCFDAWWYMTGVSDICQTVRKQPGADSCYETNMESDHWWISKKKDGIFSTFGSQGGSRQDNVWIKVTLIIYGTQMKLLYNDSQLLPSSGWQDIDTDYTSGSIGFRTWIVPSTGWWLDDVKVRKYTSPEPSASVGSEETPVVSISVSPDKDWGTVVEGQTLSTLTTDFTVTNDGNVTVNIDIHGANTTGGSPSWTLSDTATPGSDVYGLKFSRDSNPGWTVIPTTDVDYMDGLSSGAGSNTDQFGLQLLTPTSITDTTNLQTGVITFTAVQAP